jgi:superfamily II DNA or RNA helicase
MQNDLRVFRVVFVPGVVQRLARPGDRDRGDELNFKTVDLKEISQVLEFELINVEIELLPPEQKKFDSLSVRAAKEFRRLSKDGGSDERLKYLLHQRAAVSSSAAMRIPVAAKLVEKNRGQRTLVFHERIEAAETLKSVLASRGHSVTVYHSRIGPAVRRDNLRLFRRGVFDVLVSCRALDEGTNIPETTVAVIASSTASQRQRIQRLGRVLRPAPTKDRATIYTIYATEQERNRLRREAENLTEVTSVTWSRGTRKDYA